MKRLTGVLVLLVVISLFSCNAIKKLQQFYINYSTQAVFPANVPVNLPITVYSPELPTNSSQVFQNNNTNAGLIQSIKLNSLSLVITSPSGQTFSFLQNVSIYISFDSLPEVEIASKQNIPANVGDTLNLDVTGTDLESYIKANEIKLRVSGTTDQLVTTNVNVTVNAQFFVQANLLAEL